MRNDFNLIHTCISLEIYKVIQKDWKSALVTSEKKGKENWKSVEKNRNKDYVNETILH